MSSNRSSRTGARSIRNTSAPIWLGSADRVAFYQLKTMLQGVVARGTANSIKHLAPYVGGKTGTSDDENDAWFIGFTNEVTVGVWVGYDNADGKRRTLGGGQTGAKVAIPIFEPIMQAVWANYAPKTALSGPSLVAGRQMAAVPIDLYSGEPLPARIAECVSPNTCARIPPASSPTRSINTCRARRPIGDAQLCGRLGRRPLRALREPIGSLCAAGAVRAAGIDLSAARAADRCSAALFGDQR